MILCFQLCGNSLGKSLSCFNMTMPPCTKRGPYRNGLLRLCGRTWLSCRKPWPQLRARPNRPTSLPDLTNAFVAEWWTSIQVELLHQSWAVVFAFQNSYSQSLQECGGRKDIGRERVRKRKTEWEGKGRWRERADLSIRLRSWERERLLYVLK